MQPLGTLEPRSTSWQATCHVASIVILFNMCTMRLIFFLAVPWGPAAGAYPDLPAEEAGGSKVILNPPLPTVEELVAANAAAAAAAGGKGAKGGAKGGSRPASAATGAGKKPGGKDAKKGMHKMLRGQY